MSSFELKPKSLAAFERYVQLTEARMAPEAGGAAPFLWLDRQSEKDRVNLVEQLKRGDVVVSRLETRDGKKAIDVPDALVHHWIGTVLLAGTKIDRAISFRSTRSIPPDSARPSNARAC